MKTQKTDSSTKMARFGAAALSVFMTVGLGLLNVPASIAQMSSKIARDEKDAGGPDKLQNCGISCTAPIVKK